MDVVVVVGVGVGVVVVGVFFFLRRLFCFFFFDDMFLTEDTKRKKRPRIPLSANSKKKKYACLSLPRSQRSPPSTGDVKARSPRARSDDSCTTPKQREPPPRPRAGVLLEGVLEGVVLENKKGGCSIEERYKTRVCRKSGVL